MPASIARQEKLYQELRLALARTSGDDWKTWGSGSAARLPEIAVRRVKNLGALASTLARATIEELSAALAAWRNERLGRHLGDRTAAGIDASIATTSQIASAVAATGKALFNDPKKNVPDVFALALGLYAGSGGLDGDGGIPDTDLALGIGWHRSLFTHSIIAGIVVEGAILAVADLADVVCAKLSPSERDPFWDQLVETKGRIAKGLVMGTSAGISYHLAVDATLQPGTYHGLPFHMPEGGHETLFALNAAAEGLDVGQKEETTGQKVVSGVVTAADVVGKTTVAGAEYIWEFGRGFVSGLRGNGK